MLRPLHDPDLAIPEIPPAPPGLLDLGMAPVALDAVADDAPFDFCTRRVHAHGTTTRGIIAVTLDGHTMLQGLHVQHALLRVSHRTSLGLQRTLDVHGTTCTESTIALPDVPALTIEWVGSERLELLVEWRCVSSAADDTLHWHCSDDAFICATAAHSTLCVAFTAPVLEWSVTDASSDGRTALHVRARIAVGPEGIRLHATSARSTADLTATLGTLRNVVALCRSLAAVQRRRRTEEIAIATADADLDLRFEWAKQQVTFAPIHTSMPDHDALHALALVAAGDVASARTALESAAADHPLFLLLVARYHAWTADTRTVTRAWSRIPHAAAHALETLAAPGITGENAALITRALAEIAATADDIGQRDFAADVSARMRRARVTHADALRRTHWLDGIDQPAARALTHGSADGPHDAVILGVVCGMFGVEPEAARNRLRIRPRLPASWTHATLRNIRMGDATVALHYAASGGIHMFTATQETGGVPVRLILEPLLAIPAVHAATVDGQPADLAASVVADRIMVPVQLVLDETRVFIIDAAPRP